MDDKRDYKATLKTLDATASITAILNKLGEVEVGTEDAQLQRMVEAVRRLLRQAQSSQTAKLRLLDIPRDHPPVSRLAEAVAITATYCNKRKDSGERQWEILARQAGWTPPVGL